MMKYISKVLAIILVLAMLLQLVACSGSQRSTGTEAVASDTSVSGTTAPKISVSTISPNVDGEGYETHTETYNLDDAVGIQPIDFDNLYVIADSLNWKQDLNAFTVQEISVVYYEPALIEDFLISQQSFEEFFGWSTSDLQEFGNTALTFSSEGEVSEAITITPVKSTSTPYDYKSFFGKLAAGCGILLIGATLSVATGGTFTCALMAVSRAALSGAVISGAVVSTYETCKGMSKGQSVTEAFINSADSSLDAFASGFVIGAICGSFYSLAHPVCFVAETPLATPYGTVPIEDLCLGDTVLTKNMRTGVVEPQPVLNTFTNEAQELVHIVVNGETTTCTPEHPFYSPTKGWTAACQLRAGDVLVSVNGQLVVVEQIQHELLESPVLVYNIETANHNYFVGSNASVLVHNKCSPLEQKLRTKARNDTWGDEVEAVKNGTSNYPWTPQEIEELLRTGKVSGYEVAHIVDCQVLKNTSNAYFIGDVNNTVILKEMRTAGISANPINRQHYYVHDGNWGNPTNTDKIIELLPWAKDKVEKAKLLIIPK